MEERISKSQKKREADILQKAGMKLVTLPASILDKIPLPEYLRKAIYDARGMKGNGAIRRQAQLIGKIIRTADHEAILKAMRELL
jgi:ribosome-associated protein